MPLDSTVLNSTVNSFKEFLSTHASGKDEKVIANIKEDMRHFLRLYKYFEDPSLKELRFEISDALEELNEVIIIELNAVDIKNLQHKSSDLSKNQTNLATKDKIFPQAKKDSLVVTPIQQK